MITELVKFANYTQNDAIEAAFGVLKKQNGLVKIRSGLQVEDDTVLCWVLDWESLEYHQAFMASDVYKPFVAGLRQFSQSSSMVHVTFEPASEASQVFGAPVTEIAVVTMKPGVDGAKLEHGFPAMQGVIKDPQTKGAHGVVCGVTVESPDQYVIASGWDSVEAHITAIAPPSAQEVLKHAFMLADFDVKHAKLRVVHE